ncbi:MAG: glycosyltransferase family 39 protein [Candidatus Paceibacterota bacterium]|jgi:4-amino-4-deoxy-L-arabinose transferase-like glycosyltransferase
MEEKITKKTKIIILCLVLILTVFLITFDFKNTPRVWVDEGIFTNTAENLAYNGKWGLQVDPGVSYRLGAQLTTNYPVIFPVAISFNLFGTGIWQARLPMIIYMFLFLVFSYLFVKKRYGFYPAILSILLLSSFAPFYGNGRPVQGEIPGLTFLVLGLLLLLYLEEASFEDKRLAIFSGISLGLAAATKSLYLLLLVVIVPATMFFWARKTKNKRNIFLLLIAFFLPVLFWFVINFPTPDLMAKFIPTIIQQAGNNGASSLSNTSLSLTETVSVNLVRFVTESTPILFLILFVSVIFIFFKRYFKNNIFDFSISECIICLFIILNWLGYLLGTGWYRYFFPAHILLYLLFPAAVMMFISAFKNETLKKITTSIIVVLVLFQLYHLVFLSDTSLVVSRPRNVELAKVLSTIPSSKKVLFYNTTEAIVFLKGNNYSQYLTLQDLFEAGDKNSMHDTSYDFILTENRAEYLSIFSTCYVKKEVVKYLFVQRIPNCKE